MADTFGALVHRRRNEVGMTVVALANLLDTHRNLIFAWERDHCLPNVATYWRLCDVLGVPLEALRPKEVAK